MGAGFIVGAVTGRSTSDCRSHPQDGGHSGELPWADLPSPTTWPTWPSRCLCGPGSDWWRATCGGESPCGRTAAGTRASPDA